MKRKEWKEAIRLGLNLLCDRVEGFGYTQKRVAQKLRVLGFDVSLPFISKVRAFVSPDYVPRTGGNVGDDFLKKTAKYIQELLYLEGGYEFDSMGLIYSETVDQQWQRHEVKEEEVLSEFTSANKDQLIFHAGGRWSHEAKIDFMNLAQHEIIEFGLRLRAFRDYMKTTGDDVFYEPIKALLKKGVDFKCYMLDPNSNIAHLYFSDLSKASATEERSQEIMRQVMADIKEFAGEFQEEELEGAFVLHTYNHIPPNHFYIIDKDYPSARILISHYIYGLARGKAPVIQFSKKSHPTLFRRYLQSFNALTSDAKVVASSHQI